MAQVTSDEEEFLSHSAEDFILFEDYESALEIYRQLDALHPETGLYQYKIGVCTYRSLDKPSSLLHFLRALKNGHNDPEIFYYLGLSYQYNYDMENASYYIDKFRKNLDSTSNDYKARLLEANHLLDQITQSEKIINQRLSVDVANLGREINSTFPDYVPITFRRDSVLIFTSRRDDNTGKKQSMDGLPYEDIYQSVKDDSGRWQTPTKLPGLNTRRHDAVVATNRDENILFVYKASGHGNIYASKKLSSGKWSKPKPLKSVNSRAWEGSVCLSPSEDTLYFSSDREGGYGGSDLYRIVKGEHGKWSKPLNLGSEINTEFDEDSPYLHNDGKTFFFSSRGHNSIGGYDVFSAKLDSSGEWSAIKNIGFPVNTIDDDIYFQLNSEASIGYFTSHRHSNFQQRSIGEKDLFELVRPNSSPVYFVFKGRVYSAHSEQPLPAIVTLKDMTDSTAEDQRIVADLNTGKFRFDLKFENRYKLTVEIGDKTYFSQELYFPYQAEMFETFLDIPLKDIPNFEVKLQDVLKDLPQTIPDIKLDEDINKTLVLIRRVPPGDSELKNLLTSGRVPLSFRKKLMEQLIDKEYMDAVEEGEMNKELFGNADEPDEPIIMRKLESGSTSEVHRLGSKGLMDREHGTAQDSLMWGNLSPEEQRIIDRAVTAVLTESDTLEKKVFDELYKKNLSPEERTAFDRVVAYRALTKLKSDSSNSKSFEDRSERLFDRLLKARSNLSSGSIKGSSNESWGILYTIETAGFKSAAGSRLRALGKVTHRVTDQAEGRRTLMLMDEKGMILSQRITDADGNVEFTNLSPDKRYHILIDDYAIAILGRSRYVYTEVSTENVDLDYLKFYEALSPEEKRRVDRIIAVNAVQEYYSQNELDEAGDPIELERMDEDQKEFVTRLGNYIQSESDTSGSFFIQRKDAFRYSQMDFGLRRVYNRLVGRSTVVTRNDSLFYDKLSDTDRRMIELLKDHRLRRNELVGEFNIGQEETDYWYVLDEVNTRIPGLNEEEVVTVSGRIQNKVTGVSRSYQVAIADEFNQIVAYTEADDNGRFSLEGLAANKRYKVLVSRGKNMTESNQLQLVDVKITPGERNFYDGLTPTQKRMIDRIIATMMANEEYAKHPELKQLDARNYDLLTVEEKKFLNRLGTHLYADTVNFENMYLHRNDNSSYYSLLSRRERALINRNLVRLNADGVYEDGSFRLKARDKIFYESLNASQLRTVQQMVSARKARADIFAENPVLTIEKAWILLDSVDLSDTEARKFRITGRLSQVSDSKPVKGIPIMLADNEGMMARTTSGTDGIFLFDSISAADIVYLLAEGSGNLFKRNNWKIDQLRIQEIGGAQSENVYDTLSDFSLLIVHFSFDSDELSLVTRKALTDWISNYRLRMKGSIVLIEGHTDYIGPSDYNQQLSERRSNAVSKFLIDQGVSRILLRSIGYGEGSPRYRGKQSSLNRRAELRLKTN